MNETYRIILKRRSIRKFKPHSVNRRYIRKIINAGRLAPSAANLQPLEFMVIDEAKVKDSIFPLIRWAAYIYPRGTPSEKEKPSFYIAILINKKRSRFNPAYSVGAAAENMILAALSFGLASCWIASIDKEKIKRALRIRAPYELDCLIAFGLPLQKSRVVEDSGNVRYWQDGRGNFFVPKRPLKDIIHYNQL
ncbi:MAG: nitroreductase family protein [Candidatus Omnitrophica bacterium]|nr:nitroreductase family protein [Candidatus Omnitrophota bacterium]